MAGACMALLVTKMALAAHLDTRFRAFVEGIDELQVGTPWLTFLLRFFQLLLFVRALSSLTSGHDNSVFGSNYLKTLLENSTKKGKEFVIFLLSTPCRTLAHLKPRVRAYVEGFVELQVGTRCMS